MIRQFLLSIVTLCFAGYFSPAHADAYIFNEELKVAYQHYDATLTLQRNSLLFESGASASNCEEYLTLKQSSVVADGVNNRNVSQEYLVCDSVALLKQAGARISTFRPSPGLGKELLHRLDLRTFPSSLRQRVDKQRVVPGSFRTLPMKADQYSVSSATEDWLFEIEVVAEFDIDGNGKHDWLLWLTDVARQGTYRAYHVLIVPNPSRHGLLSAEIVP